MPQCNRCAGYQPSSKQSIAQSGAYGRDNGVGYFIVLNAAQMASSSMTAYICASLTVKVPS